MRGGAARRAAGILLLAGILACSGGSGEARSPSATAGLAIALATDRARYAPGDEIRVELRVVNRSDDPVELDFRDGQRHDFALEDGEGTEVWRWSDGRGFTQALGSETLGPGRDTLVYRGRYDGELQPGSYRLTGTLTSSSHPMSATLPVVVRP